METTFDVEEIKNADIDPSNTSFKDILESSFHDMPLSQSGIINADQLEQAQLPLEIENANLKDTIKTLEKKIHDLELNNKVLMPHLIIQNYVMWFFFLVFF